MPSAEHAANWEDVSRIALALPEASERISRDLRQWRVDEKLFVWERPLRRKEIVEAWLARAPKRLAREYIDTRLTSTEE
jgi:hypothetical protein